VYSFKFLTSSTLLFIVLFAWAPTIGFFFISQSNINKIIAANKRASLDTLQHQIETMYDLRRIDPTDRNSVPSKEDLDRLDKLVALYERVQGYSNTSLDWRSIINVITILLLPMITLILDYLAPIREFFSRITQAGG
jgi:ABC-type bacteriocin/lantibiotic exporter with double-glycine peptidase domain